ncbi:MAG: signal peptidase II [Rhizobiaceae bacterium]|jgi:signal peptidase II|nr:signal peptidase II [Rhizobiaceae bacterium]
MKTTRFAWLLLVLALLATDQYLKYLVETMLPLQEAVPVFPMFSLYRTYNPGVAFSMLSGLNGWPLNLLTIAIIAFVLWLWHGLESGRWISAVGYALVIGGALGNLVDRIRLGKVVDMILLHTDTWSFAIFNVADTFITIGAAAIILDEFLRWRSDDGEPDVDTNKDRKENHHG